MKHHFAGDHDNVAPCKQSPDDVKDKFMNILEELQQKNWVRDDECFIVDEAEDKCHIMGDRKQNGGMDAFMYRRGK